MPFPSHSRRKFLVASAMVGSLCLPQGSKIVLGAAPTPEEKFLRDECADVLSRVPTKSKGASDELQKCLNPLDGLHSPGDGEMPAVYNTCMRSLHWYLGLPEERRASDDKPNAKGLQTVLLEEASKEKITVFDKGKDYKGWKHRLALQQMLLFWAAVKKIKPEELPGFIRKYAEQFHFVFEGQEVSLSDALSDWEIKDIISRYHAQAMVNANLDKKGSKRDLEEKGIIVTASEVDKTGRWISQLKPFCEGLGHLEGIFKAGTRKSKLFLMLATEAEHFATVNYNAETILMYLLRKNNPLAFFPELQKHESTIKYFEEAYDTCRIFSVSPFQMASFISKAFFGVHWKDHLYPVDERGKPNRDKIMGGYIRAYPSTEEGKAALQRGGKSMLWLGGGHTAGMSDMLGEIYQLEILGLEKDFFYCSGKSTKYPDIFNNAACQSDLMWVLFREREIREALVTAFYSKSGIHIDTKIRGFCNTRPLLNDVFTAGKVGSSERYTAEKEAPAKWQATFAPYSTDH